MTALADEHADARRGLSLDDVHPQWRDALADCADALSEIAVRYDRALLSGQTILPAREDILRVFRMPLDSVRVLIVGQDPYPTPGHAMGLSFAVNAHVRPLPRSLANIYRELHDDMGIAPAVHGDLSAWQEEGVMLLNRVLTVDAGAAGSHRGWGWERVTEAAIRALAARGAPLVAILWGADAQTLAPLLGEAEVRTSAHPSPLSARRGFFGSRPFSRANDALVAQGGTAVNWQLPEREWGLLAALENPRIP